MNDIIDPKLNTQVSFRNNLLDHKKSLMLLKIISMKYQKLLSELFPDEIDED
jgi:hypothetical protein